MKRSILSIILLAVIALSVSLQGCKKEEADDTIDGKTVNYTVLVVDSQNSTKSDKGLSAANVTASINGVAITVATDATGHANFTNIASGVIPVTVVKANYTTLNYLVDLTPAGSSSDYDATLQRNSSTMVTIFPTSGSGCATVSGKVEAELDIINGWGDLEDAPNGTKIFAKVTQDLSSYNFHSGDGQILNLSYEGIERTTTVSGGEYSLTVPASAQGLTIVLFGDEFEYNMAITTTTTSRQIYATGNTPLTTISGHNYIVDINY